MYRYDDYDQQMVDERVRQFRDQTHRYLAGELPDAVFRPLRLQNGLYIQRHAPMLRIAIPYGHLRADQLRMLASIARRYDKGYGHFTTRQNIQFNWVRLEEVPEILADLATVQMHATQTSGNCVRNTTTDQFAGVAHDELVDPRPWCELIRQWSTFHPEFAFLPRKFKIAISGSMEDRAATLVHDVGLHAVKNAAGEIGFRVLAGGGLGRTPIIGAVIREFLPPRYLLSYLDAILRVYNRYGRRDNLYKARIKVLVKAITPEVFAAKVEAEWAHLRDGSMTLTEDEIARISAHFTLPAYDAAAVQDSAGWQAQRQADKAFNRWCARNVFAHKQAGYAAVTLSLKSTGCPPGDATADQLDGVAALAEQYSFGEVRVSHGQNLILPDVRQRDLPAVWRAARTLGFATPNIGLISDIICCPGGDFCDLANARSIPLAEDIQKRVSQTVDGLDYQFDLGDLDLNISGCMNSCGHHHIGHIGILGVDKHDSEWYQISLGGRSGYGAQLGRVIGPSFAMHDVPAVISEILGVYLDTRQEGETFLEVYDRIGLTPFKQRVYGRSWICNAKGSTPPHRHATAPAQEAVDQIEETTD